MELPTIREQVLERGLYEMRDDGEVTNPNFLVPFTEDLVTRAEKFQGPAQLPITAIIVTTEAFAALGGALDGIKKFRDSGSAKLFSNDKWNGDFAAAVAPELDSIHEDEAAVAANMPQYPEVREAVEEVIEQIAVEYGPLYDEEIVTLSGRIGALYGAFTYLKEKGDAARATVN